jgi:hypothetical protein
MANKTVHKAAILAMRAEGKTYKQIQAVLGCSLSTISFHCGEGQREKNYERRRNRQNLKRLYVQKIKTDSPCMDCKVDHPHWVMEFDHVRGTKINSVSRMTQLGDYSLEDIKAEIEKCELVCSNCHKSRTYYRMIQSGDSLYYG